MGWLVWGASSLLWLQVDLGFLWDCCIFSSQWRYAERWTCAPLEWKKRNGLPLPDPFMLLFPGGSVSCRGTALFNFLSQSCCGTEVCFQACPCSCSCSAGGCRASGPAAELSLVKGGEFRSDEDLARHLSKPSVGFVAKLTPTGSKLARGVPPF